MTFKEAREKAARAYKAAAEISEKMKAHQGAWPADVKEQFDRAMDEFTNAHNEAERLQRAEELEGHRREYLEALTTPEVPIGAAQEGNARRAHKEAFNAYVRGDRAAVVDYANHQRLVQPAEIHALLSNTDTLGGFLVPDDVRANIIKAESQFAVLAPLCRVENTSRDALVFPKIAKHATDVRRSTGFTGTWRAQGYVTGGTAPTVQNYPTFQQERIPVHSWQPDAVEVSPELLEDAEANVEMIIADAIAECRAFDLDDAILNGTGLTGPEGILQAGITTVNSGGATSIAYTGVLGMYVEVPSQYRGNATWVMASRTMGAILQLNTGSGGVYLFPPNQWNATILNRPVVFLDSGMATATAAGGTTFTASDKPIIFGDFRRYILAQRRDLRIQRLVERFAPNVGFLPTSRIGGQVVLTDAFRVMTVAA